jgi:hypothetical protein
MMTIGVRVRVLYPEYVAGRLGRIQAAEAGGRWLVRLETILEKENHEPLLLSLEESELEIFSSETSSRD